MLFNKHSRNINRRVLKIQVWQVDTDPTAEDKFKMLLYKTHLEITYEADIQKNVTLVPWDKNV